MRALSLNVFVDGYGHETARRLPVFDDLLPHAYPLHSVLGYTNTALPTILTGAPPAVHGAFTLLKRAGVEAPFSRFRWLRLVPGFLGRVPAIRRRLNHHLIGALGWTGWFSTGAVPIARLGDWDWSEQRDIFGSHPFPGCPTVIDRVAEAGVPIWVFDRAASEERNVEALEAELARAGPRWAFLALQGFDGLVHAHGTQHPRLAERLRLYRQWVERLLATARAAYDEVRVQLFSDHGLADVTYRVDVTARLKAHGVRHGRDAFVMRDATLARFHWVRPLARDRAREALPDGPLGRWLQDRELADLGCLFPDRRYGEDLYLLHEGGCIHPNDISYGVPRALHGYHPEEAPSMAAVARLSHAADPAPHCLADLARLIGAPAPAPTAVAGSELVR